MTTSGITSSQRTASRVAGFSYLLALPPALFAELYVSGQLMLVNDAAGTARQIVDNERLFRLGVASNLFVFALDVVLITALYVVLKPVSPPLALLAAFWRVIETTILVVATLADLGTLRVLGGSQYLQAFEPDRLYALAALSIGAHGAAYNVGLVFAGLGTTLFCYLWLRSRLMPRLLAAWGILAGIVLSACAFGFIVAPELRGIVSLVYYGGPIFLFELAAGLWLLVKGLPRPGRSASDERGAA